MNGTLIPHTPIAVDFWRVRKCPGTKIFFLTHLHGDHTSGLTPTWSKPIYCTHLTKKLLIHKFQIDEKLIHGLAVNESHTVWLDDERCKMMTVTVIDACHCPGSCMFLFQGYFGSILHTGDFRYTDSLFVETPLQSLQGDIDILYLDNTYSNPRCEFPPRCQVQQQIFNIIDKHPGHQVLVGMHSLGKEDLLVAMAMRYKTWVVVSEEQYQVLTIIGVPNVFTTSSSEGFIHVVPINKINNRTWDFNRYHPTLAILPSALYTGINKEHPYTNSDKVFVVPYSDHSSFSELREFVKQVRPRKIVPIVRGSSHGPLGEDMSSRANMSCYKTLLNPEPATRFNTPLSVTNFMRTYNLDRCDPSRKRKRAHAPSLPSLVQKKPVKSRGVIYCTPPKSDLRTRGDDDEDRSQNNTSKISGCDIYSQEHFNGKETIVEVEDVESDDAEQTSDSGAGGEPTPDTSAADPPHLNSRCRRGGPRRISDADSSRQSIHCVLDSNSEIKSDSFAGNINNPPRIEPDCYFQHGQSQEQISEDDCSVILIQNKDKVSTIQTDSPTEIVSCDRLGEKLAPVSSSCTRLQNQTPVFIPSRSITNPKAQTSSRIDFPNTQNIAKTNEPSTIGYSDFVKENPDEELRGRCEGSKLLSSQPTEECSPKIQSKSLPNRSGKVYSVLRRGRQTWTPFTNQTVRCRVRSVKRLSKSSRKIDLVNSKDGQPH